MKRGYFLLSIVMAAAIALFGAYLVLTHNLKDTRPPVISVEEKMLEISVKDEKDKLMTGITAMDDRDPDFRPHGSRCIIAGKIDTLPVDIGKIPI